MQTTEWNTTRVFVTSTSFHFKACTIAHLYQTGIPTKYGLQWSAHSQKQQGTAAGIRSPDVTPAERQRALICRMAGLAGLSKLQLGPGMISNNKHLVIFPRIRNSPLPQTVHYYHQISRVAVSAFVFLGKSS